MLVSGYSSASAFVRSASAASDVGDTEIGHESRPSPTYFRTISSISHGTLASAYLAMKSHETGTQPGKSAESVPDTAADTRPGPDDASGAIVSGAGIPSALNAYAEVMEIQAA